MGPEGKYIMMGVVGGGVSGKDIQLEILHFLPAYMVRQIYDAWNGGSHFVITRVYA